MKIAFFTDVLLPPDGGIEQHVLDTSRALALRGHEVRVYYPAGFFARSQAKNPKFEYRNSKQIQNINDPNHKTESLGNLNLEHSKIVSDLGFRISDLRPVRGLPAGFVWPNFRFAFPLHLYFELKKWKPDVIHFHTSGPMAWAAIILSRLLNFGKESPYQGDSFRDSRPILVGTFHSYLMEKEYLENFKFQISNFKFTFGWLSPLIWSYVRFIFNRCDVVVSPSEWVAKDIKNHGIYKPVKVVHNGADLTEFGKGARNEEIKKLREKYHLGENVLLYVGRLSREKGLGILLKAVQYLSRHSEPNVSLSRHSEVYDPKNPRLLAPERSDGGQVNLVDPSARGPQDDERGRIQAVRGSEEPSGSRRDDGERACKLLLVGDGPMKGELKKLAGDLGISDQVIFLGRVNHSDLPGSGLFEVSKAFVTASRSENQPLTIIEAMAKGLPIIGVSARGVTELINGNGLLALPSDEKDLANKIHQLLSDEEARIKMGGQSRKMSQDYSLSKAAENLEKLYKVVTQRISLADLERR